MLNLQVNSLLKVLTVNEQGTCEDGRTWVRCTAISFFDEEEKVITLSAFGYYADMILDNHTGENMRRARVTGTLEVTKGKVTKTKKINGVPVNMVIPEYYFQIVADTVRFIDKSNLATEEEYETTSNAIQEGATIDFTDDDEDTDGEVAATGEDVTFTDDDDTTTTTTANKSTKNDKKKNKHGATTARQRAKVRNR